MIAVEVVEVLGWAGAAALLVAYGLNISGRMAASSHPYVALNLAGSAALALNGATHGAWPSAALNLLWLTIGLTALRPRGAGESSATDAGRADAQRRAPIRPRSS